jgi:hypothetical protein
LHSDNVDSRGERGSAGPGCKTCIAFCLPVGQPVHVAHLTWIVCPRECLTRLKSRAAGPPGHVPFTESLLAHRPQTCSKWTPRCQRGASRRKARVPFMHNPQEIRPPSPSTGQRGRQPIWPFQRPFQPSFGEPGGRSDPLTSWRGGQPAQTS